MFATITYLLPMLQSIIGRAPILEPVVTLLASVAVYRLLSEFLLGIFRAFAWLRRKLLGREYLEGTWIGCLRRDPREYTVERFRQEHGVLEIEGDSYLPDGTPRAHWKSTSARIDGGARRLIYSYICDIEGASHSHEGVAAFHVKWDKTSETPPNQLEGYAADLTDGNRDANTEYKIAHKWIGKDAALKEARRKFK